MQPVNLNFGAVAARSQEPQSKRDIALKQLVKLVGDDPVRQERLAPVIDKFKKEEALSQAESDLIWSCIDDFPHVATTAESMSIAVAIQQTEPSFIPTIRLWLVPTPGGPPGAFTGLAPGVLQTAGVHHLQFNAVVLDCSLTATVKDLCTLLESAQCPVKHLTYEHAEFGVRPPPPTSEENRKNVAAALKHSPVPSVECGAWLLASLGAGVRKLCLNGDFHPKNGVPELSRLLKLRQLEELKYTGRNEASILYIVLTLRGECHTSPVHHVPRVLALTGSNEEGPPSLHKGLLVPHVMKRLAESGAHDVTVPSINWLAHMSPQEAAEWARGSSFWSFEVADGTAPDPKSAAEHAERMAAIEVALENNKLKSFDRLIRTVVHDTVIQQHPKVPFELIPSFQYPAALIAHYLEETNASDVLTLLSKSLNTGHRPAQEPKPAGALIGDVLARHDLGAKDARIEFLQKLREHAPTTQEDCAQIWNSLKDLPSLDAVGRVEIATVIQQAYPVFVPNFDLTGSFDPQILEQPQLSFGQLAFSVTVHERQTSPQLARALALVAKAGTSKLMQLTIGEVTYPILEPEHSTLEAVSECMKHSNSLLTVSGPSWALAHLGPGVRTVYLDLDHEFISMEAVDDLVEALNRSKVEDLACKGDAYALEVAAEVAAQSKGLRRLALQLTNQRFREGQEVLIMQAALRVPGLTHLFVSMQLLTDDSRTAVLVSASNTKLEHLGLLDLSGDVPETMTSFLNGLEPSLLQNRSKNEL